MRSCTDRGEAVGGLVGGTAGDGGRALGGELGVPVC